MGYKTNIRKWRMGALALFLLWGCSKEVPLDGGGTTLPPEEDEVSVVMTLTMPGSPAASRGLSAAQEDAVNNVDIFVFDKNLQLTDWQYGLLVEDAGVVSFSARLRASKDVNDKFRIMVLANARDITYPLFKDADLGGHKGDSYAQVRELLVANVPTYGDITTRGIPMWGEIEDNVIIDNANRSYTMNLLRSLARIDIGTNPTPVFNPLTGAEYAALDNFSLEEVYVFSSSSNYMLAPERPNYSFTDKKVDAVSLPTPNNKETAPGHYSDTRLPATVTRDSGVGYAVTAGIYTGEADILMGPSGTYGDSNHDKRMALVVAGYYTAPGEPLNTSTLSYYRIDFKEGTNSTTLTDVLRNCDYQIVVRSVNGPGSSTKEEAMEKFNADLVAIVKTWTNAGQAATVVDGQYFLSIDRYDIISDKWKKENDDEKVKVTTNVTEGWSARVKTGGSWLSLTGGPVVAGVDGDILYLNLDEIPTGTTSRKGEIEITAGKMTLILHVEQTDDDSNFRLLLSSASMLFPGRQWDETAQAWTAPDSQDLTVDWFPDVNDYGLSLASYVGGGVTGFTPPATDNSPTVTVSVDMIDETSQRVQDNPFYERSSLLTVTAWNADLSETISKQVLIRQVFYSLVVSGTEDYYFQGKSYTFNIKANTAWTAEVNGDNIFSSVTGTSGTGNSSAGENMTFTISPSAAYNGTATITFKSPDKRFPDQTFTIVAQDELPNCYIVEPNSSVTFPVRKAYRVWKYDRDLKDLHPNGDLPTGAYAAELMWQDAQGLITGVTLNLDNAQPDQSTITVTTAGKTGNAVVKFTIGGTTYWSWHIWVVDPATIQTVTLTSTGKRIMDRLMGATSSARGNVGSIGLVYQGGRKDPFPLHNDFTTTAFKPIYNLAGTSFTYETTAGIYSKTAETSGGLPDALKNPNKWYLGSYGSVQWYGLFSTLRLFLWRADIKSDYDPCPEGWKVIDRNDIWLDGMQPSGLTNYGIDWYGAVYPSQGHTNYQHMGTRGERGVRSITWLTVSNGHIGSLSLYTSSATSGTSSNTTYGFNVRCAVDE